LISPSLSTIFHAPSTYFHFDQNDIAYPLELRLSSSHLFGDASQQPSRYRLRGLVTHVGSRVGDGHYKALCRYNTSAATQCFSPHDVWFEFDDEHIDVITDEASILSRTSGVYLLFYEAIP
jgi:ubiquitin C-terminal hydrolase